MTKGFFRVINPDPVMIIRLPQSSDEEGARARPRRVDESGRVSFLVCSFFCCVRPTHLDGASRATDGNFTAGSMG